MKGLFNDFKREDGSLMIIYALVFVMLLGFAALTIDVGMAYITKNKLQNAADAAALAASQDLPDVGKATATAKTYFKANLPAGYVNDASILVDIPLSTKDRVSVTCSKEVKYGLAKALGHNGVGVKGKAVVAKSGSSYPGGGPVLPFLNYTGTPTVGTALTIWDKDGPGNFSSIWEKGHSSPVGGYSIIKNNGFTEFYVDYENGVKATNGNVNSIKDEVKDVCERHKNNNLSVYVLNIKGTKLGKYTVTHGGKTEIKNNTVIQYEDLELVKCKITSINYSGSANSNFSISTKVEEIIPIGSGTVPNDPSFTGSYKLIE